MYKDGKSSKTRKNAFAPPYVRELLFPRLARINNAYAPRLSYKHILVESFQPYPFEFPAKTGLALRSTGPKKDGDL